ncbi:MAG: methionyl-tRNA formyltransferase [Acidiferrobacterales bacterium]
MSLRVALFGQAQFGKDTLDGLVERGHKVVGVFATPEGPRPDPLAERAKELGITLVRRRYYRKKSGQAIQEAVDEYRALDADLNVLASVQVFIPSEITDAPKHKSICFHPSLLPLYRGGAAIQWQIIDGVDETGVSIFVPDQGVDTGPVVFQKGGVRIGPTDTTGSLFFSKLQALGVEAILEAVDLIDKGEAAPEVQDESRATHQGLIDDKVAAIDLACPAAEIDRLVRGCDPQPGAFLRLDGNHVRLFDVKLEAGDSGEPGEIVAIDDTGIVVALQGGHLRVGRVRADQGKEPASAFAARAGITAGQRFESGSQD